MYLKRHRQIATLEPTIETVVLPSFVASFRRFSFKINVFESPKVSLGGSWGETSVNYATSKSELVLFSHDGDSLVAIVVFYDLLGGHRTWYRPGAFLLAGGALFIGLYLFDLGLGLYFFEG